MNEAKRLRNFLISTSVGAFEDLVDNQKYGIMIEQESVSSLASVIHRIISENLNIDVYDSDFDANSLSWKSQISKIQL